MNIKLFFLLFFFFSSFLYAEDKIMPLEDSGLQNSFSGWGFWLVVIGILLVFGLIAFTAFLKKIIRDKTIDLKAKNDTLNQEITERSKIESRLEQSEKMFRTIIESVNDFIAVMDMEDRYKILYGKSLEYFELYSKEFLGKTILEKLGENKYQAYLEAKNKILNGAQKAEFNFKYSFHDSIRYFNFILSPIYDENNEIKEFVSVGRDVTDLKKIEKKLLEINQELETKVHERTEKLQEINQNLQIQMKEKETAYEKFKMNARRFRTMIENLNDIIVIVDKTGMITYSSPSLEKITFYKPEEVIGKSIFDFVRPELQKSEKEKFESLIKKGEKQLEFKEKLLLTKKGRWKTFEVSTINLLNDPAVYGVVFIMRDITFQKFSEKALYESEKRYRNLVESSNEVITMVSKEGYFLFMNMIAAQFLGGDPQDLIGRSLYEVLDDKNAEVFKHAIQEAIDTKINIIREIIIPKQHELYYFNSIFQPVKNDKEDVVGILIIAMDITPIKKAEEEKRKIEAQLIQAQKMEAIGRLAGGISHDFKNFIAVISGYADLILLDIKEGDEIFPYIQEIKKVSEKAFELTQQLLLFSRKETSNKQITNLNYIIKNNEIMSAKLAGKNILIEYILDENLFNISANERQVEQILMNLIINAKDAMDEKGRIMIKTYNTEINHDSLKSKDSRPGSFACLSVKDSGVGIPKEALEKIFEPFFTTKPEGKGTGLGLSIVYGIIAQHKGFVEVESGEKEGTEFKFYFPITQE